MAANPWDMKFEAFFLWLFDECDRCGVYLHEIRAAIPRFYTAMKDQTKEMNDACLADSYQRFDAAVARYKTIFGRAVEQYNKVRAT